jgi:hypothetical protein
MKYIAVTYVDKKTGVPGFKEPMKRGPVHPEVKGLNIEWWDASRWPIQHPDDYPLFYGTCDDDADLDISGVMRVFEDNEHDGTAKEQYDQLWNQELKSRLPRVATARQIRLALVDAGLLDSVQTAFEDLSEPLKTKAQIEWEYATEIEKNSPLIQALYPKLGLTEDDLDDLFVAAANMGSTNPNEDTTTDSDGTVA